MWKASRKLAYKIGLHIEEYWSLTLGEFYDCIDGYQERLRDKDYLNHILGGYIATGINNPKKYPKIPLLSENETKSIGMTTDSQLDAFICANYERQKKG